MAQSFKAQRDTLRRKLLKLKRAGWTYPQMAYECAVPVHVFEKWLSEVGRAPETVARLDAIRTGVKRMELLT